MQNEPAGPAFLSITGLHAFIISGKNRFEDAFMHTEIQCSQYQPARGQQPGLPFKKYGIKKINLP